MTEEKNVLHLPTEHTENKRRHDLGAIPDLSKDFDKDRMLEIFRRMAYVRAFEYRTKEASDSKEIDCLVYLGAGQESLAAATSMTMKGQYMYAQHRGHPWYINFGGDQNALVDELMGLETGSNKGMGGSPPIQDFKNGIVGHVGLIGDHVPVATGAAMFLPHNGREKVVCVFGDGAAEEDYVLASLGHAGSHKLPILYICDDNDLSVLTPTKARRDWDITEVAASFGIKAIDIADDPWLIDHWVQELSDQLPALINIRTCRELWHVGTGCDGAMEWDRYEIVKQELASRQLSSEASEIEETARQQVEDLWNTRLQTQSAK